MFKIVFPYLRGCPHKRYLNPKQKIEQNGIKGRSYSKGYFSPDSAYPIRQITRHHYPIMLVSNAKPRENIRDKEMIKEAIPNKCYYETNNKTLFERIELYDNEEFTTFSD